MGKPAEEVCNQVSMYWGSYWGPLADQVLPKHYFTMVGKVCCVHHFSLLEGAQSTLQWLFTNATKQRITDTSVYSEQNEGRRSKKPEEALI